MNEITDQLWIGNINDVRENATDRFDRVVTVCQDDVSDNVGCEYDFYCMSDGPANSYGGDSSYELFEEATDTVREAIEGGETVLVHCHMGQSRSAAVCIAVYCSLRETPYWNGYQTVDAQRGVNPDSRLRDHAKRYIVENADGVSEHNVY